MANSTLATLSSWSARVRADVLVPISAATFEGFRRIRAESVDITVVYTRYALVHNCNKRENHKPPPATKYS